MFYKIFCIQYLLFFSTIPKKSQHATVRYPGHTIQLLNYDYSQFIRKVLELLEINPEQIKWCSFRVT